MKYFTPGPYSILAPRCESLSACGRYVYSSSRCWDLLLPTVGLIRSEPTTRGLRDPKWLRGYIGWSIGRGYGSLVMCHVFAYRSNWKDGFRAAIDPVGPGNWEGIPSRLAGCDEVICCWGKRGNWHDRGYRLADSLRSSPLADKLRCVGYADRGVPLPLRNDDSPLEEF